MNLKFWKKPQSATMQQPEWWRQSLTGNASASGQTVTIDQALTVPAVYACVRIISESISALPFHVYRKDATGRHQIDNHPVFKVLGLAPNGEQTPSELIEFMLSNVLLRGNAYAHRHRDARGQVAELEPLYTKHMQVDRDADGALIFDYQEPGNSRVLRAPDLWRIAGLSSNGVTGYSPIVLGREGIGVALSAEQQAATLFANGLQVPRVLEKDGVLTDEAFARLKAQMNAYAGSGNAHKTMILEEGLTLKNVGMTLEDSQFLESRKFQIGEIATWFKVPLHKLNQLDRATFSNIEHQSLEFVQECLAPWINRLEQTIVRDLIVPSQRGSIYPKFALNGLLRGDIKTRFESYRIGREAGIYSANEVRALEDLNPVEGLDDYIMPMNFQSATEPAPAEPESDTPENRELRVIEAERRKAKSEGEFIDAMRDFYNRKGFHQWPKS